MQHHLHSVIYIACSKSKLLRTNTTKKSCNVHLPISFSVFFELKTGIKCALILPQELRLLLTAPAVIQQEWRNRIHVDWGDVSVLHLPRKGNPRNLMRCFKTPKLQLAEFVLHVVLRLSWIPQSPACLIQLKSCAQLCLTALPCHRHQFHLVAMTPKMLCTGSFPAELFLNSSRQFLGG